MSSTLQKQSHRQRDPHPEGKGNDHPSAAEGSTIAPSAKDLSTTERVTQKTPPVSYREKGTAIPSREAAGTVAQGTSASEASISAPVTASSVPQSTKASAVTSDMSPLDNEKEDVAEATSHRMDTFAEHTPAEHTYKFSSKQQSVNIGRFTYRSPAFEENLLESDDPRVDSVADAWIRSVYQYPTRPAFSVKNKDESGTQKFSSLSFEEADGLISDLICGIMQSSLLSSGNIGLLSNNRKEFQFVNLALARLADYVLIPLDIHTEWRDLKFICGHSSMTSLFVSSSQFSLALSLAAEIPSLKVLICLDHLSIDQQKLMHEKRFHSVNVLTIYDLLRAGTLQSHVDIKLPNKDSLFGIFYIRGQDDAHPRGVMLTHGNIISSTSSMRVFLQDTLSEGHEKFLSLIPLSSVQGIVHELFILNCGGCIGYSEHCEESWKGEYPSHLREDFALFQPTILAFTPFIGEMLKTQVMKVVQKKGKLFSLPFQIAMSTNREKESPLLESFDKRVFNPIRKQLGFQGLKLILCCTAPLLETTQMYLQKALNVPVNQEYGLTECCGPSSIQHVDDFFAHSVGGPLPCCEFKLQSLPLFGLNTRDEPPTGELLIRGYNVSKGYFREDSKDFTTPEGFLPTGDIVQQNTNGSFSFKDNKHNIVSLDKSHHILLGYLEALYGESRAVEQIVVCAREGEQYPVAIVLPHQGYKKKNILSSFRKIAAQKHLQKWEKITRVHLIDKRIESLNEDYVNSTCRFKRNLIYKHFESEINKMYNSKR